MGAEPYGDRQYNPIDGDYSLDEFTSIQAFVQSVFRSQVNPWESQQVRRFLDWVQLWYDGPVGKNACMPVWAWRLLALKLAEQIEGYRVSKPRWDHAYGEFQRYRERQGSVGVDWRSPPPSKPDT